MQLATSYLGVASETVALCVVASSGDEAAIQLLLDNGADIEQKNHLAPSGAMEAWVTVQVIGRLH